MLKILVALSGLIDLALAITFLVLIVQSDGWRTERSLSGRIAMATILAVLFAKAVLAVIVLMKL